MAAKLRVLKGKLREQEKTYADCAKQMGISITTFSEKINGRRKFTVEEANDLSNFLQLTDKEKVDIFLN